MRLIATEIITLTQDERRKSISHIRAFHPIVISVWAKVTEQRVEFERQHNMILVQVVWHLWQSYYC